MKRSSRSRPQERRDADSIVDDGDIDVKVRRDADKKTSAGKKNVSISENTSAHRKPSVMGGAKI